MIRKIKLCLSTVERISFTDRRTGNEVKNVQHTFVSPDGTFRQGFWLDDGTDEALRLQKYATGSADYDPKKAREFIFLVKKDARGWRETTLSPENQ